MEAQIYKSGCPKADLFADTLTGLARSRSQLAFLLGKRHLPGNLTHLVL